MHDLVIDNARLIDGLGTAARDGSLAVKDGRIDSVSGDRGGGDLGPARDRVDAGGLVLAPGIVDLHTHYDAQLTWDPFATPSNGRPGEPRSGSRLTQAARASAQYV